MSNRLRYADEASRLVEVVEESRQQAERLGLKNDKGMPLTGDEALIAFLVAWVTTPKRADGDPGGFHDPGIPAFCKAYALGWGVLAAWIRRGPERNSAFQQGLLDRGLIRKERLLDLWWQQAEAKPDDAPTHGDVHKAREALAKAEGVFESGKAGITVTPGDGTPKSITVTFVDAAEGKPA